LLELGRGGMGTVYLAIRRGPAGFQKLKVVKILNPSLASEPEFLRMFLDEARLAARLNHPNVVQTNEVGVQGDDYFIEMEYLEGQPYDALLRRGAKDARLTLPVHAWILTQALAGLHYAHELRDLQGAPLDVVHRDVSPHNVFVTYEGAVKLLDFGIAKAVDSQSETRTGAVKGKATYMAPEQAARRPRGAEPGSAAAVDRRADVFAVGVMLWQAVTGRRLWDGLEDGEIFVALRAGQIPRARDVRRDAPPILDDVCARALAVDPADRYPTAEAMHDAIEAWLAAQPERPTAKSVGRLVDDLFADRRAAIRAAIGRELDDAGARDGPGATPPSAAAHRSATMPIAAIADPAEPTGASGASAGGEGGGVASPRGSDGGEAERDDEVSRRTRTTGAIIAEPVSKSRRTLVARIAGAAAVAALAALSIAGFHWSRSQPPSLLPARAAAGSCGAGAECGAGGGAPSVCRRGRCVPLDSADCTASRDAGARSDETIWFGVMLPLSGAAGASYGRADANALELARRDFALVGGVPGARPEAPMRPLGLVVCDDAVDPRRAAQHLADLEVPVVMGFGSTAELIDVATRVFLPRGTLLLDMLSVSPLATQIPRPDGGPRLVWRTTANASQYGDALAHLVSDFVEPAQRASIASLGAGGPMRLALVRSNSAHAADVSDALVSSLRINGKTAVENRDRFRQYTFARDELPAVQDAPAAVVDEIVRFAPHAIAYVDGETFLAKFYERLEAAWTAPYRPVYVSAGILEATDAVNRMLAGKADRRRRFFAVELPADTDANLKFTLRYNELFSPKITPASAPGVVYDAFYLAAYAAAAASASPLRGADVAAAMSRIRGDGVAVDVGPAQIFQGFQVLRDGKPLHLRGAGTELDLDPASGESPSNFAVYCFAPSENAPRAISIESGLRFDHVSKRLEGTPSCR